MRPAHVFAKPSAGDDAQIVALLQGPWRFALRLVMIWLSLRGLTAAEIAVLFEYDPRTVRRWINRSNAKGVADWRTVRARVHLAWGAPGSADASGCC